MMQYVPNVPQNPTQKLIFRKVDILPASVIEEIVELLPDIDW